MKKATKSMVIIVAVLVLAIAGYYLYKRQTEGFEENGLLWGVGWLPGTIVMVGIIAIIIGINNQSPK